MQFYRDAHDESQTFQADVSKELKRPSTWLAEISTRVDEIGKAIDSMCEYSYQYNVKIVGMPELSEQESYLSNNCDFKVRDDLSGSDADVMESLFIEIVRSNEKNIVVGVIYRPPNTNVDAFVSKHCEIVEKLSRENKLCYLMGDFNLNLLNHGNHLATGEFMDGLYHVRFFH